jgi:CYTH domain-containing protein
MGWEIERKFLVRGDGWRTGAAGTVLQQGYLAADVARSVRVRLAGDQAFLTIKGKSEGLVRREFEYAIPAEDAAELLHHLCLRPLIEKTRYRRDFGGRVWEIDEFSGENAGLILAEVELAFPDECVALPDWVGDEVSRDPRYYNANLIRKPYSRW